MSVHPTKSGKWEARWREGSKNRSRTFDRKGDAQTFDAKAKRKSQMGEALPARTGGDTLEDFFLRWLAGRHSLAPRTIKTYEELFEVHILGPLGYVPLASIDPERIEKWQSDRFAAGAGRERISKAAKLLSQVFDKAAHQGKVSRNPVTGLESPQRERKAIIPASPEKVEAIRAFLLEEERMGDATLVSLMAYGGLRMGEALALQWPDLSQGNRLWISHSLEDDGSLRQTKTGKDRLVKLPEPTAEDLLAWRRESGPQGLVFPRAKDGYGWTKTDRNNWRRRCFLPAAKAAGWPYPPKNLRHSAASLMIASGMRPTEVAEALGHTLAVSVNVYQRLMREFEGQPIRPMDDVIREARELRTSSEHADENQRLSDANSVLLRDEGMA
jgi:integrase